MEKGLVLALHAILIQQNTHPKYKNYKNVQNPWIKNGGGLLNDFLTPSLLTHTIPT